MKLLLISGATAMSILLSCSNGSDSGNKPAGADAPSGRRPEDTVSRSVAPSSNTPGEPRMVDTAYITGKGEFYCEGNVAADGLGCVVKIDGVVYKMQQENSVLYEDADMFTKAGKPVPVTVVYKKTGTHFKMMNKADGPELITIRSVTPVK